MTNDSTQPARDLVLRLRRVLPASRERVYDAVTNPTKLALWWGPNGFTCSKIYYEPRVGGSYRITIQPPDGEQFTYPASSVRCRRRRSREAREQRRPFLVLGCPRLVRS